MTATPRNAPPILLLHGFWHGAWCWTQVAEQLCSSGRRVLAVDMAGHGLKASRLVSETARPFDPDRFSKEMSPIASVDLDAAGDVLIGQIQAFATNGPVVVVAHSFGGPILSRAAQTLPDLISHMVYLSALMPASDVPTIAYLQGIEQAGERLVPLLVADPAVVGAVRLDVRAGGDYGDAVRSAFYADVDVTTADAAIALLSCDAPATISAGSTTLTASGWGRIPRTYIYCTDDYAVRPALQRRFIREADEAFPANPTNIIELKSSHSPFLSMPGVLAAAIDGISSSSAGPGQL